MVINLFFVPTSNYANDGALFEYTFGPSLDTISGSAPTCTISVRDPSLSHQALSHTKTAMQRQMDIIVHDSALYTGFVQESRFMDKQMVFEKLSDSTALMNNDTVLNNFYIHNQNTSIGKIYAIKYAIRRGDYATAANLNNSITAQITPEQNYKDMYTVLLNTVAKRIRTATANQLATIQNIATQCPLSGGRAVFEARTLVNALLHTSILYNDNCSSDGQQNRTVTKPQLTTNNLTAKVYPNPANTILNVLINLQSNEVDNICLYNSLGEVVRCLSLKLNITTLPINDLAAGIYYYRIADVNGNLIKADKIMVIH